jgi:hypothetical protein
MQCQNKLSLVTNPNYGFPTNEVNFFDQRCRSMVVTMHKERGSKRVLDSVCITPFRCRCAPDPRVCLSDCLPECLRAYVYMHVCVREVGRGRERTGKGLQHF